MTYSATSEAMRLITYIAITLIAFGLITERLSSNFITWFFFVFFVIVGIMQWVFSVYDARIEKISKKE